MRLINDYYRIIGMASNEDAYSCKVRLAPDHDLYKVHFPGYPVTPGACLLQMATEMLELQTGRRLLLRKATSMKFKKTIGPHEQPTFVFTRMVWQDNGLKVVVGVEDGEVQFATMALQYVVMTHER